MQQDRNDDGQRSAAGTEGGGAGGAGTSGNVGAGGPVGGEARSAAGSPLHTGEEDAGTGRANLGGGANADVEASETDGKGTGGMGADGGGYGAVPGSDATG